MRLTQGFSHNRTKSYFLGAHLLSPWWSNLYLHSWPREIDTLSPDTIYHTIIKRKQLVTWKSELFVFIEDNMACFNEKNGEQSILEYFESFDFFTDVLGILTFGAIIVIHGSNYLSVSQIGPSHYSQYNLYNVDTVKHSIGAKWHRVSRFAPGWGEMVQFHIFLFYPYLKNIIIYAYISCLNTCIVIVSRFLPNIMIIGWVF